MERDAEEHRRKQERRSRRLLRLALTVRQQITHSRRGRKERQKSESETKGRAPPPPPLSHTHAHVHTRTRALTHSQSHTLTHSHTHTHTRTRTRGAARRPFRQETFAAAINRGPDPPAGSPRGTSPATSLRKNGVKLLLVYFFSGRIIHVNHVFREGLVESHPRKSKPGASSAGNPNLTNMEKFLIY